MRVLLAEDNATRRLVAITRLEMLGHRVDTVSDGAEAVAMVQTVPYDLLLMDVIMLGLDELSATRVIRALPGPARGISIVAMTANVFRKHPDACRVAGMDGFHGEPFNPEDMERLLARAPRGELRRPGTLAPLDADIRASAALTVFAEEARQRIAR
jgi:CheY-like chemotaxis protein